MRTCSKDLSMAKKYRNGTRWDLRLAAGGRLVAQPTEPAAEATALAEALGLAPASLRTPVGCGGWFGAGLQELCVGGRRGTPDRVRGPVRRARSSVVVRRRLRRRGR